MSLLIPCLMFSATSPQRNQQQTVDSIKDPTAPAWKLFLPNRRWIP